MTYTHKWNARDKCYDIMTMDLSRVVGKELTRVEADRAVKLMNLREREIDIPKPKSNPLKELVSDAVNCAGSQKALAIALDTHQSAVSSWYRGDTAPSRIYQAKLRGYLLSNINRVD